MWHSSLNGPSKAFNHQFDTKTAHLIRSPTFIVPRSWFWLESRDRFTLKRFVACCGSVLRLPTPRVWRASPRPVLLPKEFLRVEKIFSYVSPSARFLKLFPPVLFEVRIICGAALGSLWFSDQLYYSSIRYLSLTMLWEASSAHSIT